MNILKPLLPLLGILGFTSYAQEFDANIQLRPRFEYRNGYKNLLHDGDDPATFISQRSRINLNFKQDKLSLKLSLQNIRTWGDVPTTTTADKNGIQLFEASAEYRFDEKWSARIGRQVISYDNQRIFGGIDWLQQGQSHDAAVITFHKNKNQLDLGAALNASSENVIAPTTAFTTTYKNMQYAWYHTNVNQLNLSLLFLNTGYEYAKTATELQVDYKQTFGTYITYKEKKWDLDFSLYGQSGKSGENNLSAWNAAANIGYAFSDNFKGAVGYEFLSGKDKNDSSTKLKSFTPIFGTNHAFNGFMDYFYVGNHQNNVGLQDVFLKLNYSAEKWQFTLIPHVFNAAAKVLDTNNTIMNSYLGTEIDFTTSYKLQKDIMIVAGYSQFFGTSTLEVLKTGDASKTTNWAWLMININPQLFSFK